MFRFDFRGGVCSFELQLSFGQVAGQCKKNDDHLVMDRDGKSQKEHLHLKLPLNYGDFQCLIPRH